MHYGGNLSVMHPWEQLERAVQADRVREGLEHAERHRRRRRLVRRALKALVAAAVLSTGVSIAVVSDPPTPDWAPRSVRVAVLDAGGYMPGPAWAPGAVTIAGGQGYDVATRDGRGMITVPPRSLCTCIGSATGSGCAASLSGTTLTVRTYPASSMARVVCFPP